MEVFFWGVRGSIPTPGKSFEVYGGNTSCVEVRIKDHILIFDMGSGLKNLGDSLLLRKENNFDIFLSHFHYDHTCGLPFFKPSFNPNINFNIRSGRPDMIEVLESQISSPSFPITIEEFKANINYSNFKVGEELTVKDDIIISTIPLNHPDGAVGYRVEYKNKAICYITDHEHEVNNKNEKLIAFVSNSDLLIYDSTYRDEEFESFKGWGHSTWQEGARLSNYANVKKYAIFHHNPDNKDDVMKEIEKEANLMEQNILVAKEGMSVKI
ncbi:MBL fold metallo-hydrolase [Alphaproteobacteria bacterium]|nr:MBL fold metallo-hydrolase [Alphaproteobacteria bacterium]